MMDEVIRLDGLGKVYQIGAKRDSYPTLRDLLADRMRGTVRRFGRRARAAREESRRNVWALREVSLSITTGEVVGVIGSNGAGKTTLLKILSRITEPTEGHGLIRGRVGSLLEVGTGFHPELTGRENIFLNGVIIGMTRAEIERRFDEIVSFSGVEAFIDTPVKRYSSGMYLRLAFSVAAHLEPEILLVDEVLAVGDVEFQKKCLGKIGDFARSGRTVVFASHNLAAVQSLCGRALCLDSGRLVGDGDPRKVIADYLREHSTGSTQREWRDAETAPGSPPVRLRGARVRPEGGSPTDTIDVRTPFVIEVDYSNDENGALLAPSVIVVDEQGIVIFHAGPLAAPRPLAPGLYRDTCHVPGDLMNDGLYRIQVEIQCAREPALPPTDVLRFDIADSPELRSGWYGKWAGAVRPMLAWDSQRLVDLEAPDA